MRESAHDTGKPGMLTEVGMQVYCTRIIDIRSLQVDRGYTWQAHERKELAP